MDLFVLGLAQCHKSLHLDSILSAVAENVATVAEMDKSIVSRVRLISQNICKLKEYITAINKLELSDVEFGLLKVIAIFNSSPSSVNSDYFESISDAALAELRDQPKNKKVGQVQSCNEESFGDFGGGWMILNHTWRCIANACYRN